MPAKKTAAKPAAKKKAVKAKAARKAAPKASAKKAAPARKADARTAAASAASGLVLYDLGPSPNSMKVRVALGYKGLTYRKIAVDPEDRAELVRVSRQPLTPVLVHEGRVVYDSAAILRYLDANFPATFPLFSSDYQEMKDIERWERYGRVDLSEPVGMIFSEYFAEERNPAVILRANTFLQERTARIEKLLALEEPFLVGGRMTAADVTAAPWVFYGMLPPFLAASNPIAAFFGENLKLGEGRERTREWVRRVMAHDR